LLGAYAVLVAVLMLDLLALNTIDSDLVLIVVASIGVLTLAVGVGWWSPPQRAGWWLVTGGMAAATFGAGSALAVTGRPVWAADWIAAPAVILTFGLVVSGLAIISRVRLADALDAVLVALALFLVGFTVLIQPATPDLGLTASTAVVLPLGLLLTLVSVGRAALNLTTASFSVILLLVGVTGLTLSAVALLVPALSHVGGPGSLRGVQPAWVAFGAVLGAAGLHPSMRLAAFRNTQLPETPSLKRIVLYVAVAIVVPIAWVVEVANAAGDDLGGAAVGVPTAASVSLLAVLVWRLVLVARVAYRQAAQLRAKAVQLSQALREEEALQHQLRYQATHDALTGLSNRFTLGERLEWILTSRTGSQQHPLSVVLLDLDGFKDINDTMGHPIGDELLIEASHRLLAAAPQWSTVARLGGDEFVALLERTPPGEAFQWAEQLRHALRKPFRIANQDLYLSTSVGVYTADAGSKIVTPSDALRNADLALYAAKAAGKNRVEVFRPELRAQRQEYTRIATGLRRALVNDEFDIHYQPIVDLMSRRVVGVEALLRWTPGGVPVPPDEFIPIAEEDGSIVAIGAWVMKRACQDAGSWFHDSGITTAVNVSANQLNAPGLVEMVTDALKAADLPGRALTIEITETAFIESSAMDAVLDRITRLRKLGINFAIDDFGIGYSSLSNFANLPVDTIKIDKSFVPAAGSGNRKDWEVTRTIVELAGRLGLAAIAEGVETLEQAEALRALHCERAQGYLFARPMSKQNLLDGLAEGNHDLWLDGDR
jgi:diguanylate cyclase (GGDEF)-like protein